MRIGIGQSYRQEKPAQPPARSSSNARNRESRVHGDQPRGPDAPRPKWSPSRPLPPRSKRRASIAQQNSIFIRWRTVIGTPRPMQPSSNGNHRQGTRSLQSRTEPSPSKNGRTILISPRHFFPRRGGLYFHITGCTSSIGSSLYYGLVGNNQRDD